MKRTIFYLSSSIFTVCLVVLMSSCNKNDNPAPPPPDEIFTISSTMSGTNEVSLQAPTTGTGTVTGTYNATKNLLAYNVTWSGLTGTATVGHFHSPALPGVNATPLVYFILNNNGNAGTASGSINITDAQEVDLLAGRFYANIHTALNSGGEIRGQVAAVK
jgi:hypothetical protein